MITRWIKVLVRVVALLVVSPVLAWYWLSSGLRPSGRDEVLQAASQLLALLPGKTGSYLRVAFYSRVFNDVGSDCYVGFGTIFATPEITLGDRVYIGPFCNIGHVDIGNDVLLGSNVTILSGKHQHHTDRLDVPMNRQGGTYARVGIGDDCWLGNASIVMAGIEEHSVVAAGAVVTKPVARGSVVAGSPARVLRNRLEGGDDGTAPLDQVDDGPAS